MHGLLKGDPVHIIGRVGHLVSSAVVATTTAQYSRRGQGSWSTLDVGSAIPVWANPYEVVHRMCRWWLSISVAAAHGVISVQHIQHVPTGFSQRKSHSSSFYTVQIKGCRGSDR